MKITQAAILVVDDDLLNRVKLSTNLEAAGYAVALAENGAEALAMMRAQPFDTILLDLMMPVMDGYEVLEQIKADKTLQHLPVIVISGEDDQESVVRCIEIGAADHLPKPFNPTILRARISACVEKKRSHDREIELYSELQQRYRELKELGELRDDLTHMIVHDLRTPLTSLLSGLQTIPIIGEMQAEQNECLNIAVEGGESLLSMINELLDISKMESGSLQLEMKRLDPISLVESALAQVTHLAQDKGLVLTQEISPNLSSLIADDEKLVRVLVNLCGNAIKFTPSGGNVTIRVQPSGPQTQSINTNSGYDGTGIIFSVADTGEGIPTEYFDRIFKKFGQVENRKSGRKMSTGLGLTFCKMIVEQHLGRIWVESELGKGSVFCFYLPLHH